MIGFVFYDPLFDCYDLKYLGNHITIMLSKRCSLGVWLLLKNWKLFYLLSLENFQLYPMLEPSLVGYNSRQSLNLWWVDQNFRQQ